jgi:hypothetical protein
VVGGLAGLRGGRLDAALMRASEIMQTIPQFFLALLIVALTGRELWKIIGVLAILGWEHRWYKGPVDGTASEQTSATAASGCRSGVDARPRGERGQLLEQRERLEHELPRAVRPRRLEREHDAAIVQEPEPVLRHRRSKQIAAQLLQAHAIRCRHRDVGVQIETG